MAAQVGPSQAYPDPCTPLPWEEEGEEVLEGMIGDGRGSEEDLLFTQSDLEGEDEEGDSEGIPSPQDDDKSMSAGNSLDERCGGISLEVEAALVKALASKSLTPILKEELRCKIQLKRLQHGQQEMTPDFSKKTSSMSMEEIMKRNRKMEQNRLSAHKSRQRQKTLEKEMKEKCETLQRQNSALEEQVKLLRQASHQAKEWLSQHHSCIHRPSLGYSQNLQLVASSFSGLQTVSGSLMSSPTSVTIVLP